MARTWQGRPVAVKTIHGVTSDGRAEDELQMYGAVGSQGMEHRVVGCLAIFQDNAENGGKNGVVMQRIPTGKDEKPLEDLALPPTIREVTVDRWHVDSAETRLYDSSFIHNALVDAVDALLYLHGTAGVAHGDFYAHNIKVDVSTGRLYLLDLGASWATGAFAQQAEKKRWDKEPMKHSCEAYLNARKELSILLSLHHEHIVPLVGVSLHPLCLLLSLAPLGALSNRLMDYQRAGSRLPAYAIRDTVLQVKGGISCCWVIVFFHRFNS